MDKIIFVTENNGIVALYNETGKYIPTNLFSAARSCVESYIAVKTGDRDDGKWGFVDYSGNLVIEPQWKEVNDFSEGYTIVRGASKLVEINNEIGSQSLCMLSKVPTYFIDKKGNILNNTMWDDAMNFSEGLAAVKKNNKWGFIDKKSKIVIPIQWDEVKSFSEGLAVVKLNNSYGYIDKTGKIVVPLEWKFACPFKDGVGYLRAGFYGPGYLVDYSGNVSFIYPNLCAPSEGLAMLRDKFGGKCIGYVDKFGNMEIEGEWDDGCRFHGGFAGVKLDGKWGFIDKYGRNIVPCIWEDAGDEITDYEIEFSERLARVRKNGKWGFINTEGNLVISPRWDGVSQFKRGYAIVEKDAKRGVIDKAGNLVLPCLYDAIHFENLCVCDYD